MSTQHTPGPWHRNIRANGKYPTVFAGRNQHVATVCQQKDGAETEANIDLITAAPALKQQRDELLAALRAIEKVAQRHMERIADDHEARWIAAAAHAAIAKATE
jgi:small-conductance mechanosensitive channel